MNHGKPVRSVRSAKVFFLVSASLDKVPAKAPGFDKNNWPDMSDTTLRTSIYSYYKAEPYW